MKSNEYQKLTMKRIEDKVIVTGKYLNRDLTIAKINLGKTHEGPFKVDFSLKELGNETNFDKFVSAYCYVNKTWNNFCRSI